MKFTFRGKLFIYFITIILITSIPIALLTYNYMYESLKKDIYLNTKEQMIQIDRNISIDINKIKEDVSLLTELSEIKKADESISALFNLKDSGKSIKYSKRIPGIENSIFNNLEAYGITHPQTTYVYLGTKWGGYIRWPDGLIANNFDPRVRPWYSLASASPGSQVVTEPYLSAMDFNKTIITISKTVNNSSGEIIGAVGVDVTLDKLSEMIRDIKIGSSGYVFLYSKSGTMLAHPDSNLNFKSFLQIKDLGYSFDDNNGTSNYSFENYRKFMDTSNGSFEITIDGSPVLVNVYTSADTGWKMASIIPKSQLINKTNGVGYIIFIVTCIIILLVIGLTLIITKRLTKPISDLKDLMNIAGNGNLEVKANINSDDEFGQLGNSFNLMIEKLGASYEEITAVNEELIATEEELKAQYDELLYNEEALRNSEEKYRMAIECANDLIWEWDLVTNEFFTSDKIYDIIGYRLDKNINIIKFMLSKIHPDDKSRARSDFKKHVDNITDTYNTEFRLKNINDDYVWLSSKGKLIRDLDNKPIKFTGSTTDITERKISEEKVRHMAYFDSLTNLPNRAAFIDKLNKQLELLSCKKIKGAVFFIDLDNFKNINDTLGHEYGDKVLVYLAKQFEGIISEKDTLCRLGGDEFMLLHPFNKEEELDDYAKKFLKLFSDSIKIDDKQMFITASIGAAVYPKDGIDTNDILKNADSAMYKAKELGKNRFVKFDPEMFLKLERKTKVERILRTAIKNNELSINYQPQYDVKRNKIFGFEALLRLNSTELGFISPLEFITIAEESGYITELSRWVLNETLRQSVEWFNAGYKFESMSINVSSLDIQQPDFLQNIKDVLEKTKIDPCIVELEITETVLMQSVDSHSRILQQLIDMGIRIALDDFGTGYSSLNYLRKIPITTLKIDKSFIDNITSNNKEESIINSIIQMAHSLDLKVVAEGVETQEQLEILEERNCDYIQGYYFSRPLPAKEIENLLK